MGEKQTKLTGLLDITTVVTTGNGGDMKGPPTAGNVFFLALALAVWASSVLSIVTVPYTIP